MEPSARMKQLVEMSHNISVDRNISIAKYFNSGRELIKSATLCEEKGDIEKAFVLYLRYMTLFLEKLIHHPEWSKADKLEKAFVKNECNRIFDRAEALKKTIKEKYENEFNLSNESSDKSEGNQHNIEKRSVADLDTKPKICDVDEIDAKYNFSQKQPTDSRDEKGFDPFNIEELRKSFDAPREH